MEDKYVILSMPTKQNDTTINVVFLTETEYEKYSSLLNTDVEVLCPRDHSMIQNDKSLKKHNDPLSYLLDKSNVGLLFAATHGIIPLFRIMIAKFNLVYKNKHKTYENYSMKAIRAAVIGGHIEIVHICKRELNMLNTDLSALAVAHKRLDILVYEFMNCKGYHEDHDLCVFHKFFDDTESFKNLLDSYKEKQDETKFKDMINRIMDHAGLHIDIVELLVSYGADDFKKVVKYASSNDRFDIVDLLLENTHDSTKLNEMKRYAIIGASSSNNKVMVKKYLMEHNDVDLNEVIMNTTDVDVLDFCIQNGAKITNEIIENIIKTESQSMLKYLMDNGIANIKVMIESAIDNRKTYKIRYLVEQGEQHLTSSDYKDLLIHAARKLNTCRYCYNYSDSSEDE